MAGEVTQVQLDQFESTIRAEIRQQIADVMARVDSAIHSSRGMTSDERERFIRLETRFALVEEAVISMRKDIKEMHDAMTEAKGGWRVLLALAAVAGGVGAFLVKLPWGKFLS